MSKRDPWILGISSSHNASVCLLKGDEIVVAIQEERLSRLKRHRTFGSQRTTALEYCLDYAKIKPADLEMVAHAGCTADAKENVRNNPYLNVVEWGTQVLEVPHHLAHAISAFATSGFRRSAVLVVDGRGSPAVEFLDAEKACCIDKVENGVETMSLYSASNKGIVPLEKHVVENGNYLIRKSVGMQKFRSLGAIFDSCAKQIFGNESEAGKVMGLAPFGEQAFPESDFFEIVDGCFRFHDTISDVFDYDDRWPLRQREYMNLAASAQLALESAILYLVSHLHSMCPSENLCYAGGVALNSVANERIIRESPFRNLYVVPAAEDSGPAIGAAYYGLWQVTKKTLRRKLVHDAVGRPYSNSEIIKAIGDAPSITVVESEDVLADTVDLLCQQKVIGWFQGRSELGPRALGQRSILCDPRRPDAKELLNSRVKHREAFRPFAPAVLKEEASKWFDFGGATDESPYMLRVCPLKAGKAQLVPAIVHVDGTGRVQTLTREANGRFYELVDRFFERTGVPIVLNTSFNTMGEPIIETPQDALLCLMATGLDYCVLEDTLVSKNRQLEFRSVTVLLDEVAAIKERALDAVCGDGGAESVNPASDNERVLNQAMEDIHRACLVGIEAFRSEVREHLGTLTADMEPKTAVRLISDLFSPEEWEALEAETRLRLTTAAMMNSLFMRYGGRKDWVCAIVDIFRAIEIEMRAKLIDPFLKWSGSTGYPANKAQASLGAIVGGGLNYRRPGRLSRSRTNSTLGDRSRRDRIIRISPVRSLQALHCVLLGPNADLMPGQPDLLGSFKEYSKHFDQRLQSEFFDNLQRALKYVIDMRDKGIRDGSASREDAVSLLLTSFFFLKRAALFRCAEST